MLQFYKTMKKTLWKQFFKEENLPQGNFLFMAIMWNNGQLLC